MVIRQKKVSELKLFEDVKSTIHQPCCLIHKGFGAPMADIKKLLKKHKQLNQLDMAKVTSHIQREQGDWVVNTVLLEGYDVPFQYTRKQVYRSLKGARVNLTYYPETKAVAGVAFEIMKVVRIRRS